MRRQKSKKPPNNTNRLMLTSSFRHRYLRSILNTPPQKWMRKWRALSWIKKKQKVGEKINKKNSLPGKNKRDDKCCMNLKNKCHVRRLKPRKKIYFRKEKGLVEKEATSPSSKERVEKFGYTSSQISNVNRNNVIFQHISILKKNLHLYSFTYFIHNLLCLKCSFSSLF